MNPKNPNKLYPLVLTSKLGETKAFYLEQAGFELVHDLPTYLHVRYGGSDGPELAFMKPDAFPDGKARPAFDGRGLLISIPTSNADEKHAALARRGVPIVAPVEDKPWGWRSFFCQDPNGVILDFFHVYKEMPASP
jgi:uncharacterized glyoxalase superfamily protein PhnB